jgi:predicted AlkP superfamily pyrophosphatase or phosphodiesterase
MHLHQIMPALFAGLGLADAIDEIAAGESPNGREVVFLIDGLGDEVIEKYASYLPTLTAFTKFGRVQTSFPSTTATSLATLTTGTLPGAHGMLGYTVRVPRSGGRILNSLRWDDRVDPKFWQPIPTLFERGSAAGINVSHVAAKRYENSGFTQAVFRGATYRGANLITELVLQTKIALVKSPALVYLYMNDLDVAGHSDGVGSDKWLAALTMLDDMAKQLVTELPIGTRIWLTADHGMINVDEKIVMGRDNHLLEGITTIAGEPRARHLYLAPELDSMAARSELKSRWESELGDRADIYTRESAVLAGLFGTNLSENALDRMGEIIVIAKGGLILIEAEREALESAMVGHHGALTEIENHVPLLQQIVN